MYMSKLKALVALVGLSVSMSALSAVENAGELDAAAQQIIPSASYETDNLSVQTNWRTGTYGPVNAEVPPNAEAFEEIPPFGSHLFTGGFRGVRADGMNSNYRVTPGDQVALRIWGAVELERILPVDARGNVFVPAIGPVKVQGLTHKQLDSRVRSAVRSVYPENVHVYTNLQGVQPVAVFVTGFVNKPGRYAGTPNDSAIYFLDQAGGIDDALGSYREIRIIRNNKVIAVADLYQFLLKGKLPRPQFRDGDTLLVTERQTSVAVLGDVERELRYELTAKELQGAALVKLARMKAGVSHVLLRGDRKDGPMSEYLSLKEFAGQALNNGDEVLLSVDKRHDSMVVEVEGSYYGASRYALPRGYMLHDLLNALAVPEHLTDAGSISIKRKSVALRQKASLDESLKRLETTYLGAPSATTQEATIRVKEAELIERFVEKAAQVEPTGRLVVALDGSIANIRLQDGDIITIPEKSDSLLISGEVLVPQSVVFKPGRSVQEYISGAGGFTQHADEGHILIISQNGEVRQVDNAALKAGDEILVLPKVPTKNLQLATSISQILYQLAVAAKVVTDL